MKSDQHTDDPCDALTPETLTGWLNKDSDNSLDNEKDRRYESEKGSGKHVSSTGVFGTFNGFRLP